jgi:hypothetical protein
MKICLIGDSRLGAIKLALDEGLVDLGKHEISFFAAVAGWARNFKFTKAAIRPGAASDVAFSTEGKFSEVRADAFDVLVFYATKFGLSRWARPNIGTIEQRAHFTDAFLAQCVEMKIANSFCMRFAYLAATTPGWPTKLIVCPAPAQAAPRDGSDEGPPLLDVNDLNAEADRLCKDIGVRYVPQPANTLTPDFYTDLSYSIGSRRYIAGHPTHPSDDRKHMNAAFGALMLRDILAALD